MRELVLFISFFCFLSCTRTSNTTEKKHKMPNEQAIDKTIKQKEKINSESFINNNNSFFYILENKYLVLCFGDYYQLCDDNLYNDYNDDSVSAKKRIKNDMIDNSLNYFIGKVFITKDSDQQDIQVKITDLLIYAKYYPHWSEYQSWTENNLSPSDIERYIWDENKKQQNPVFVVGLLDQSVSGEIATPVNSNKPTYFEKIDDLPVNEINQLCKNTPEYIEFASELDQIDDKAEYHTDYSITGYRNPITNENFYIASIYTGNPCGGKLFFESHFVVKQGQNQFEILPQYSFIHDRPLVVFDIDGDNLPEFLYSLPSYRLERTISGSNGPYISIPVAYHDCDC